MSRTYLFGTIIGSCEGFRLYNLVVGLVLWREVEQNLFGLCFYAGDHCLIQFAGFLRQRAAFARSPKFGWLHLKQLANDVRLLCCQLVQKTQLRESFGHRHKWSMAFSQQLL